MSKFQEHESEVLVVGAGPVGMMTELNLADAGIRVQIIDTEPGIAAHSYACALHPASFQLLNNAGLGEEILGNGRRIDRIAFYEGESRRTEIWLEDIAPSFPFLVVLPQSTLEGVLQQLLYAKHGVAINWNHRLSDLESGRGEVVATVERLAQSGKGYAVPDLDWEVDKRLRVRAPFVLGADGSDSWIRHRLGIDSEHGGPADCFSIYEFEYDGELDNEARVVLDGNTTSVFWPLPNRRCRWTLQVTDADTASDGSHIKERSDILVVDAATEKQVCQRVQQAIQERAPWFQTKVRAVAWSAAVQFEHRVVLQFGEGRCWLLGDAAHQTGPIGMQSMNAGLAEAKMLAEVLTGILRENKPVSLLSRYNAHYRTLWKQALGIDDVFSSRIDAPSWVKNRGGNLLSCIPAFGEELFSVAQRVGLDFVAA